MPVTSTVSPGVVLAEISSASRREYQTSGEPSRLSSANRRAGDPSYFSSFKENVAAAQRESYRTFDARNERGSSDRGI